MFFFRITITTKGKYTAINEGKAIQPLVDLVDDEKSEVRLNALKVELSPIYLDFISTFEKNILSHVFIVWHMGSFFSINLNR